MAVIAHLHASAVFYRGKRLSTHLIGGWEDLSAGLLVLEKRKITLAGN